MARPDTRFGSCIIDLARELRCPATTVHTMAIGTLKCARNMRQVRELLQCVKEATAAARSPVQPDLWPASK